MTKQKFTQHNLSFIGAGYVGLVSGTCLAEIGHNVILVDNNPNKIKNLKKGIIPIYEPGLDELVKKNVKAKRLSFTTNLKEAVQKTDTVFIAVNTPPQSNGKADLSFVANATKEIAEAADTYKIIVDKSTVPVNTGERVAETVRRYNKHGIDFDIVSNPEFLREGCAIDDFLNPDRIVVGVDNKRAAKVMKEIYAPIKAPLILTDVKSAEIIKHASNSFLATKISFVNALARICELSGANIDQVAHGMGLDKRIGRQFLNAGIGYGGSCFTGNETTFTLNSPNVRAKSFNTLFDDVQKITQKAEQKNSVDILSPSASRTLSFDTENGRTTVEKITTMTKRKYEGPLVTLRTKLGRTLQVTADHPVIAFDPAEEDFTVLPAVNVRKGDYLALALGTPRLEKPQPINLLEKFSNHKLRNEAWIRPRSESFKDLPLDTIKSVPRSLMKYPHDIRRTNSMPLKVYYYLKNNNLTERINEQELQIFTVKGTPTYCPAVWNINKELSLLIGYYLAEGWITEDSGRNSKIRQRIGFAFHKDEKEYINKLHNVLNNLNIRYQARTKDKVTTTTVSSRPMAVLFKDILQLGTNSNNKQLPPFAINMDKECRFFLLQGLFSGDGSVTPVNQENNVYFEYATTSKLLAEGMVMLLQSLHIVPSTQTKWMNKSTRPAYHIRINGIRQLKKLVNLFGEERQKDINTILIKSKKNISPTGHKLYENFATVKVTHSELEPSYTGKVYSMETDNGVLVSSGGIIIHNCFPKDVSAFVAIADELGYDFSLLKGVEKINQEAQHLFIKKIEHALWVTKGKKIAVWGLAFKPNTDDMRSAPSIAVIKKLHADGADVYAYDPEATKTAQKVLGKKVNYQKNMYDPLKGADALVIMTDWDEFKNPDWDKIRSLMHSPIVIDGRNMFKPKDMEKKGFVYHSVGRG